MFSPSYVFNTPQATPLSLIILPEQSSDFNITIGGVTPVRTTDNPVIATVPPNPQSGDRFALADSRFNAQTNIITIDFISNNHLLYGASNDYAINISGAYTEFLYLGGSIGWIGQK